MTDDKAKMLENAISQIEKDYGKGAIMRLGNRDVLVPVSVIPTGALSIDAALGVGGMPRGRVIEIYGPESGGKTTLTLHIIAEAQKLGGQAAFIDAEHALDPGKKEPNHDLAHDVIERCFHKGLLFFSPVGAWGQTVKIAPPLTITEGAVREGLAVLGEA